MTNETMNGWGQLNMDENNQGQQERLDYIAIPEGATKLRILDPMPKAYQEWWAMKGNGGKGTSIPFKGADDLLEAENKAFMAKIFKEADAKGLKGDARKKFLREDGYGKQPWGKVKQKFVIHVLDRATGEIKLLDKGNGIFKAIQEYALDPEYGDPRNYDITIKRKGSGFDTKYTVTASPTKAPLTDAEKALYEDKKMDLNKLKDFSHVTPEQCLQIAKGAEWKEVLGDTQAGEKSDASMLPKNDTPQEATTPAEPAPEPAPKDEEISIDKGEALSEDELNGLEF